MLWVSLGVSFCCMCRNASEVGEDDMGKINSNTKEVMNEVLAELFGDSGKPVRLIR